MESAPTPWWRVTALLGVAVAVGATAVPATRVAAAVTVTCAAAVAVAVAVVVHRPRPRLPWCAAALMIWLWAAGFCVLAAGGEREAAGWLVQGGAGVASLMVGYLLLTRQQRSAGARPRNTRRGERLGHRVDQMIVGCLVALGVAQMAVTALSPAVDDVTWAAVVSPLDVVLACLLLRFAASRTGLRPASVLALAGALLTALYDMLATTGGSRVATADSPLNVVWTLAACLYALAALHPSMVDVFTPAILRSRRSESARLLGLAPLALAPAGLFVIGGTGLGVRLPVWAYLGAGMLISLLAVVRGAQAVLTSERRAERDPLTGMANRRGLRRAFDQLLAGPRAEAADPVLGRLCLFDVDDFKHVNDTFGHEAGDQLLVAIGRRLRDVVGARGTVARSGGDEFVVLLDAGGVDPEELLTAVFGAPFALTGAPGAPGHRVRASAGWAPVTAGSVLAHVLADADIALYATKGAEKGRVRAFHPELREDVLGRLSLVEDLRRLFAGDGGAGRLELRYQPLVELADDRVVGCEALVRWQHPDRGLLCPDEFLPLAEAHGLAAALDAWVMAEAATQVVGWDTAPDTAGPPLFVSVNLGRASMVDPALADVVHAALRRSGLPPERLHLEITEHAELPPGAGVAALTELHALGVRVSLDDFGIGYTSLDYVRRYPVSTLKLDRSLTAPLQQEPTSALLHGVVLLATSLGIDVLAEGIETGPQQQRLAALGVRLGQGYLIARPMTGADFRALLGSRTPAVAAPG